MTTAAIEPDIATHPDLQEPSVEVPTPTDEATPTTRKRGRPKGSRNKPRTETSTTTTPRAPRATTRTRTPRATTETAPVTESAPSSKSGVAARVVLIEDSGVTVVTEHGSNTYSVEPQFVLDRRTK